MKFKVFWIDDSTDWVRSIEGELTDVFEEYGFDLELIKHQEINPAREQILGSYADLLLVDCNLPDGSRGDDFIRELRQNRCFAHVLFYSQDADNLEGMAEDEHFIHVSPRDDVPEKLDRVADLISVKYKHPAFMRGLLLSEFIDLENLMDTLIAKCFKAEEEYFKRTIIHKGGESFSFSFKQKFISRLLNDAKEKDKEKEAQINGLNFTNSQFSQHIINKRNILAHAHPSYDVDTGRITLISAINDIEFNEDWFHQTRVKIHEHKNKIRDIIDMDLFELVNPEAAAAE